MYSGEQLSIEQRIGDRFAEMELVLVLATLTQRCRIHSDPDHAAELEPGLTLCPRNGLPMVRYKSKNEHCLTT